MNYENVSSEDLKEMMKCIKRELVKRGEIKTYYKKYSEMSDEQKARHREYGKKSRVKKQLLMKKLKESGMFNEMMKEVNEEVE